MRHSYGSYWLAAHKQRAVLGEHMGNSVEMIKKHYKRVVSNAAQDEYWKITPEYDGSGMVGKGLTAAEIREARARRIQRGIARPKPSA